MLTFYYELERAIINDDGSVEYHEGRDGLMVVTEAPSQTIMSMVLAVMPIVEADLSDVGATVARLRRELRDATSALDNAKDEQRAAETDISDCTIELHLVSERLEVAEKSLQQEQSC